MSYQTISATSTTQPILQGGPMTYRLAVTPAPCLGVGNRPRASPLFHSKAEDGIRRMSPACGACAPTACNCFNYGPGPNIPEHWYDGGMGWVTRYFQDVEPFSYQAGKNGRFRCQVPVSEHGKLCDHEIENGGCCNDGMCWCPYASAPMDMQNHLITAHRIMPPPSREWATDLFDMEGCADVCLCAPCHGSRQMMAMSGYADTFDWGWCLLFCFLGLRSGHPNGQGGGSGGRQTLYYTPPHWYVALLTRFRMVRLNNINEGMCTSLCTVCFCAPCSVAQTYRELSASGVWPGGTCFNVEPPRTAVLKPATSGSMR